MMLAEPIQKKMIWYQDAVLVHQSAWLQGEEPGVVSLLLDHAPNNRENIMPAAIQRFQGDCFQMTLQRMDGGALTNPIALLRQELLTTTLLRIWFKNNNLNQNISKTVGLSTRQPDLWIT